MSQYDFPYELKDKSIQKLLNSALKDSWNVYKDLPWETPVHKQELVKGSRSLIEEMPAFSGLTIQQKEEFKLKEAIYHISNLLAGEHKGVSLAAQILLGCPQDTPDWAYFVTTILTDERNHVLALSNYLQNKIGICYGPHPRIEAVLKGLMDEGSMEIKLFISQVVLEWTATSLLSALVSKKPEPLFYKILQRIIRDEGRHLMFNRLIHSHLPQEKTPKNKKTTEDLLFESIVACVSSLCAIPVWQEYSLPLDTCREYSLREMETRGVIRFYRDILPRELVRCGFHSDRLSELLKNELPKKIIEDHYSFEPKEENPK